MRSAWPALEMEDLDTEPVNEWQAVHEQLMEQEPAPASVTGSPDADGEAERWLQHVVDEAMRLDDEVDLLSSG